MPALRARAPGAGVSAAPPANVTQSSGGVGSIVELPLELIQHAAVGWMLPVH